MTDTLHLPAITPQALMRHRLASRDELKEFYSEHGNSWRPALDRLFAKYVSRDLEDLL